MLHKLFQSPEKYGLFPKSYYPSSITLILKPRKKPKKGRMKNDSTIPLMTRLKNPQLRPKQLTLTPFLYGQVGSVPGVQGRFNIRESINMVILNCVKLNPKSVGC